jgi:hypothetical protein
VLVRELGVLVRELGVLALALAKFQTVSNHGVDAMA